MQNAHTPHWDTDRPPQRPSCGRLRNPDQLRRPSQPWRQARSCTNIQPGPPDGGRPPKPGHALTFNPDHPMGAGHLRVFPRSRRVFVYPPLSRQDLPDRGKTCRAAGIGIRRLIMREPRRTSIVPPKAHAKLPWAGGFNTSPSQRGHLCIAEIYAHESMFDLRCVR